MKYIPARENETAIWIQTFLGSPRFREKHQQCLRFVLTFAQNFQNVNYRVGL
jgi:hypothetical protein